MRLLQPDAALLAPGPAPAQALEESKKTNPQVKNSMSRSAFVKTCILFAVVFCVAGAAMVSYSDLLSPYTDEALFAARSAGIAYRDSRGFHNLRLEMLSPKYALLDYGKTLMSLGMGAGLAAFRKNQGALHTPNSGWTLVALAVLLPFLHGAGIAFELDQSLFRGELPSWADSIAIAIMAVPLFVLLALGWHLGHLAFLTNDYQSAPLSGALSRHANWWLLLVTAVAMVIGLMEALRGAYWAAVPTLLSGYFTLCLAASVRAEKSTRVRRLLLGNDVKH